MTPHLTARQVDCLRLTAAGLTNTQTARRLGVPVGSVHRALNTARDTLGAHNIAHACALAVHYRIVTADHLGVTPREAA